MTPMERLDISALDLYLKVDLEGSQVPIQFMGLIDQYITVCVRYALGYSYDDCKEWERTLNI